MFLFDERSILARFRFDESLRPGAVTAIGTLRSDGVGVSILTGDTPGPARAVAHAGPSTAWTRRGGTKSPPLAITLYDVSSWAALTVIP